MTITLHMNDGELTNITYEPPEDNRLTAAERHILSLRLWHPDKHSGYTLSEIAFILAMPRERVRELQDSALKKLAAAMTIPTGEG